MSTKLIGGTMINIPVKKTSAEQLERNREQVAKLMDQMKTDSKLLQRYADLTCGKFQELFEAVQRIGLDTVNTFNQVWEETAGGEKCTLTNEQIGHAAMTTLNVVAVAYALAVMAQEAGEHILTQDEVDELWVSRNNNERGN